MISLEGVDDKVKDVVNVRIWKLRWRKLSLRCSLPLTGTRWGQMVAPELYPCVLFPS